MRATIDDVPWAASSNGVAVFGEQFATRQGTFSVSGINTSSGITVGLTLAYVSGPGAYPLGVDVFASDIRGGYGAVGDASNGWSTPISGAEGTVTITTRTSTRIAGQFQFIAADVNETGPDIAVTAGEFDVTVAAGLPPLPTGSPSVMSATIDGSSWTAAMIVTGGNFQGGILGGTISGGNIAREEGYQLTLSTLNPITAAGTYAIGPNFWLTAAHGNPETDDWSVIDDDSIGAVTVTAINSERIEGTFRAVLPPVGATVTPLAIEDGFFSVDLTIFSPQSVLGADSSWRHPVASLDEVEPRRGRNNTLAHGRQ